MRLLNVETLRPEEFPDDRPPSYAILSHTWGSDVEELTLSDVRDGNIDNKPGIGLAKLRGCSKQARNDGFGYIWIDTCCIDKTNLVELSEAINSMFRWYQRASVCYAYLSDVLDDRDPQQAEGSTFRSSRWFRRGWTLQELLAPRLVVFYNSKWRRLGTKTRLRPILEEITGIPQRFLRGTGNLLSASVAQRMSWAAKRETTRKEDMAYCLLGLFDIAMPLIYGEGGDRAFFRLQEQIMRNTRDHSILAWGLGPSSSNSAIALSRSRGFLAVAPSEFADSGRIVPRDQLTTYHDLVEISGGSLVVSLSLLSTSSGIIGLLNCGPEEEDGQVVGIPLEEVTSGGSSEYTRPRGRRSVLRPTTDVSTPRTSIYVKHDDRPDSHSPDQKGWFYDDDEFADVGLELMDVEPRSFWVEERSAIIPATKSDGSTAYPTLVRFRHDNEQSQDFILILEFKRLGTLVEAHHCVTICSRDTSLEGIAGKFGYLAQKTTGRKHASNGYLHLELALTPGAGPSVFTIKPATIPRPPEVTIDVTIELRRLLDLETGAVVAESALRRAGAWYEQEEAIFNQSAMMQHNEEQIRDLRDTLERHQQLARKYVDFTEDLNRCTWEDVLAELRKAQAAALESERRRKIPRPSRRRTLGTAWSILAPGVLPLPDNLSVLQGGLAVIFSLARHSELNRSRILNAFERVPNIIEEAENKAAFFGSDSQKPRSVRLRNSIFTLQATLLQILPILINILIPNTFQNVWNNPFRGQKIDKLLDEVARCAEAVHLTGSEVPSEDIYIDHLAPSKDIQSQMDELLRQQRSMQLAINSASGNTNMVEWLIDQLKDNSPLGGRGQEERAGMGTAPIGYTPEGLLHILNVNHLLTTRDANRIVQLSGRLPTAETERAARMIAVPELKQFLESDGSSVFAFDGRFDRSWVSPIGPLSYISAMFSSVLRQEYVSTSHHIVLEYYCALHELLGGDDDLSGPQGLIRCLTTQLIFSLIANDYIDQALQIYLPHLHDELEEQLLEQQDLHALCRLFAALTRLVPSNKTIYCVIDSLSVYERKDSAGYWRDDFNAVLGMIRDIGTDADAFHRGFGAGSSASFKLVLTDSVGLSWWLDDFVSPEHRLIASDGKSSSLELAWRR